MPRVRKSGDGGLYFDKTRNLWIGSIDNGFDENGKRKVARVSSRLQSVARTKLDNLKTEINTHGSPLGNKTVAEWGAFWLDGYKYNKPQTFRTYQSLLKSWVYPAIGRRNVKDVRPSDLRVIYDSMRSKGKSSSSAAKVHTMMSAMFEAAKADKLVATNVVRDIKPPKAAKVARDAFAPNETLALLAAAAGEPSQGLAGVRDASKWFVSLYAGLRQGERLGATVDCVDLRRNQFTVRWNLVEGNYEHGCAGECSAKAPGHCPAKRLLIPEGMEYRLLKGRLLLVPPKSGEPRTFPLLPSLANMLDQHIAALYDRPNPHGLLWPAEDGSPMSGRTDQAEWRALLAAAGIDRPTATTHWARHTAISDMTASGTPDRTIGEVVGHRSPGVTGGYQHTAMLDALEAMNLLQQRRQLES